MTVCLPVRGPKQTLITNAEQGILVVMQSAICLGSWLLAYPGSQVKLLSVPHQLEQGFLVGH